MAMMLATSHQRASAGLLGRGHSQAHTPPTTPSSPLLCTTALLKHKHEHEARIIYKYMWLPNCEGSFTTFTDSICVHTSRQTHTPLPSLTNSRDGLGTKEPTPLSLLFCCLFVYHAFCLMLPLVAL